MTTEVGPSITSEPVGPARARRLLAIPWTAAEMREAREVLGVMVELVESMERHGRALWRDGNKLGDKYAALLGTAKDVEAAYWRRFSVDGRGLVGPIDPEMEALQRAMRPADDR